MNEPYVEKAFLKLFPFLAWVRTLTPSTIYADFFAGLTGAVIILPQGIAYALIAGLPPEYGLYTAIITPIIAGLFGSSLHLISGPTIAISVVVMSVVSGMAETDSPEFISLVLTITLLTGLIQFAFGVFRFGSLVNFISHTVVLGFTTGAAILIASSQLKYVLGIQIASGSSFIDTWASLFEPSQQMNLLALTTALITVASTLIFKKMAPKLPAMLLGVVIGSFCCWLMDGHHKGIELVGALPEQMPKPVLPNVSPELISALLPGAFSIALLGLVEAVSIGRSIAIRSGQRIDGNQEFIGQGLSNVVGSCFSCYAGSGSFTRSGANYDAGARTPIAAIFAAIFVFLMLWLLPQITTYLPLPVMGGAIIVTAWNLIDIPHIKQILRSDKWERSILLTTFVATLLIKLEFAIYAGVILSLAVYLRKTSKPVLMAVGPKPSEGTTYLRNIHRYNLQECPQLKIIRIDGAIFFGSLDYIQKKLQAAHQDEGITHIVIYCPAINLIDIAGANMLLNMSERLKSMGVKLSFCGMKNTVKDELNAMGYLEKIGLENFYSMPDSLLVKLVPELNQDICSQCHYRIFKQCPEAPINSALK